MSSLPAFYDPASAEDYSYRSDVTAMIALAADYRHQNTIAPAINDTVAIEVLAIDLQKEFCHPDGNLFCAGRSGHGAIDDTRRIAEFVYRNMGQITAIRPTLDTHIPIQIFFPTFWTDHDGGPVAPHTIIKLADIRDGRFKPSEAAYSAAGGNRIWVDQYVRHYCENLETNSRYQLYIWPMHCLIGTDGHNLQGTISEAFFFHSLVRQTQIEPIIKGTAPWTENYSAFEPEVTASHDKLKIGTPNEQGMDRLLSRDAVVVVGQASSHCVRATLDSLLAYCDRTDPTRLGKIHILRDCMSAVTVRDGDQIVVDYTDEAEAALSYFASRGMHVIDSTVDLRDLPGLKR